MDKSYHLLTECIFQAPASAVWDVTVDVTAYPQWWPCMESVVIQGDETTLQQESNIHYTIKSFLPHRLQFQTHVTLCAPLSRIEMTVHGDLEGTGIASLDEHNGITRALFQWEVLLMPPLLNRLSQSRLCHKLFTWNHDLAMKIAVKNMRKRVQHAIA